MIRTAVAVATLLSLAACGNAREDGESAAPNAAAPGQSSTPSEAVAQVAAAAAGAPPAAFAQCRTCHQVEPGKHGIGPSLARIYGTKAGEIPGYAFSAALLKSGLTWDDATLDRFLESPMKTVPGTKMTYAGMKDPAKRAEIIAYLKTI